MEHGDTVKHGLAVVLEKPPFYSTTETPCSTVSPCFVLTLRAVPSNWQVSPLVRLRRLLKCLLRGYGFRCVNIRTTPPEPRA
jgi:hypothetical protein